MALYTNTTMIRKDFGTADAGTYPLWADDENELWAMAAELGIGFGMFRDHTGFPHFRVNDVEQALAIALGAVMSDFWGPKFFRAIREGNDESRASIERIRTAYRPHERKHPGVQL